MVEGRICICGRGNVACVCPKFEEYGVYNAYTGELVSAHETRKVAEVEAGKLEGWNYRVRGVQAGTE